MELQNQIVPGEINMDLLNNISNIVGMASDSGTEFPKKPNLSVAINGVDMRYKDCRDVGYIGSFTDKH